MNFKYKQFTMLHTEFNNQIDQAPRQTGLPCQLSPFASLQS